MRRVTVLALLLFLAAPLLAQAPPTGVRVVAGLRSNPFAAVRLPGGTATLPNPTWAAAGVESSVNFDSYTQQGSTLAAGTSASTINTALSNCSGGEYVLLGAGTFSISGLNIHNSGCELRGSGANSTIITFTAAAPSQCFEFVNPGIGICPTSDTITGSTNWTANYSQGTTVLTLASTSFITVGQPVYIDQNDDATDGFPATGDTQVCTFTGTGCVAQGNGGIFSRSGRATVQISKVTAKTSTTITIDPPILYPTYRSAQDPEVYARPEYVNGSGVRNLSADTSALGDNSVIKCVYCYNVRVKGVRLIRDSSANTIVYPFYVINSFRSTLENSYVFGPTSAAGGQTHYQLNLSNSCGLLIQNNIFQKTEAAIVPNDPWCGSVVAYNFWTGREGPGIVEHGPGEMMNLYEGNIANGFYGDIDHGTHFFQTLFRNGFVGDRYSAGLGTIAAAIHYQTKSRFYNVSGNVMGDSHMTTYQTDQADSASSAYVTGWQGSASGATPPNDARVSATMARWYNWDVVTSTSDNTDGDQTGTRCITGEMPVGITSYSSPVPSSCNAPTSMYLSAKPSFFGSDTWPPIGPDVNGGTIANLGGHVRLTPAAKCYLTTMSGPTNGSGSPLSFDPSACGY